MGIDNTEGVAVVESVVWLALVVVLGPVRAEPGCIATQLLVDADDDSALTWVEEWRDIGDFELHLREDSFHRIVAVIELASGPPVVEIDDVSSRRGFELVEEILGSLGEDAKQVVLHALGALQPSSDESRASAA